MGNCGASFSAGACAGTLIVLDHERDTVPFIRATLVGLGFTLLAGLSQCESQTCYDFDEQGNRIEFPCTTCSQRDDNPCTLDTWRIEPGQACSIEQQPWLEDGTPCSGAGDPGFCGSGVCEPSPVLAAGWGTTTWRAIAEDPFNGPNGCWLPEYVTLPTFTVHDLEITLTAHSDGAGNITLIYDVLFRDRSGPALSYPDLLTLEQADFHSSITNANVSRVVTSLEPAALGTPTANLVNAAPPFQIELGTRRGTLTKQLIQIIPSSDAVSINFADVLELGFSAQPNISFAFPEGTCLFGEVGDPVVLQTGGCAEDAECEDGLECTENRCDMNTNRCVPAVQANEGNACDSGQGLCSDGLCIAAGQ